tara:strand:+ start:15034 stop:19386 length:4353 start_codon:yes stop_codon:yes gene_type:complete
MGLRFRSEFSTLQDTYYKVEIHDTETETYGSDLFANPNFNGVADGTEAISPLAVGDLHEGGVIFHIDDVNNKVYICALRDTLILVPSTTSFEWGCSGTDVSADGTAIGTGQANTTAILAGCASTPTAATSTQWTDNGYSDWFLPSKDELDEVYSNLTALEAAVGFDDMSHVPYWTSSQNPSEPDTSATNIDFLDGTVSDDGKSGTLKVRAIRVTEKPFGPFITYGTPTNATIEVVTQDELKNQYSYLSLTTNSSDEGVRFDFNATDTKTYELELSVSNDAGSIYVQGVTSTTVYANQSNLEGENRISIEATSTEVISVYFRANNNAVSGGTTTYKDIRVREVLTPVVDFTLRGNDGFKLSYTGGETTYDLIKPSTVNFTMNVDNESIASLASDITSSEPERFGVRIYRADRYSAYMPDKTAQYELMWFGYINKRVMSIQDLPFPYDLNIAAVDGLLDLKKKDYKDDDGNNFFGKKSILGILSQIVTKLDVQGVFDSEYDQAILTRVNWFENSMTSEFIDPCNEAWLFVDQFTTLNNDNKVQFSSYYDVLNAICRLFQCRFLLSDGRLCFVQFNTLEEGSVKTFLYTTLGSSSGSFPAPTGSGGGFTITENYVFGETSLFSIHNDSIAAKMGFFSRTKTFGKKITNVKIPFNAATDFGNVLPSSNVFPDWGSVGGGFGGPGVVHIGQDLLGGWEDGDNISFEFTIKFNLLSLAQYGITKDTPDPYNDMNAKLYLPIWLKAEAVDGETDKFWQPQDDSGNAIALSPSNPTSIEGDWVEVGAEEVDSAVIIKSDSIFISNAAGAGANVQDTIEVTFTTTLANDHDFEGLYLYCDGISPWKPCVSGSCSGISGGVNAFWGLETQIGAGAGDVYQTENWEGYHTSITCNEISLKVFSNGEPYLNTTTQSYVGAFIDGNQNNPQALEINDIMWGDSTSGDPVMPIKSINIGTAVDSTTQSNSWQKDFTGTSGTVHKFITDDILNNNYLSAEVLQAKILFPTNYLTTTYRVRPEMGFKRYFTDTDDVGVYEDYAFLSLTFNPNKGEWSFKGRKIALTPPTVVSSVATDQSGTITSSVSPAITGAITQNTNNQLVVTTVAISPSAGAIVSISCTALPYDLVSGTVIQMQSSDLSASWFTVTLDGDHDEGDESLTITSFTPTHPFNIDTPLMVTSGSLIGASAGGANTQVQYNDNGVFAGDSDFTYNDGTGKVTATAFIGALEGTIDSSVTATTQSALDDSTKVATTKYVDDAVTAGGGGGTPDGADTEVQFNDDGSFGASEHLTYTTGNQTLHSTTFSGDYVTTSDWITAGSYFRGSNIGTITADAIYLTPFDFQSNSDAYAKPYIYIAGATAKSFSTSDYLTAGFVVPLGYIATHIEVQSSTTLGTTRTYSITQFDWDTTSYLPHGTYDVNSEEEITNNVGTPTPLEAVAGRYWSVSFNPQYSSDLLMGAKITLEEE